MPDGDPASSPKDDARSDQELVDALRDGDHAAFEALYRRYRDWVVRLARRFTGHDADALDVLQETFAYVARKGAGLRLDAAMTTFLYPVVRNLSVKAAQRRRRFASDDAIPDVAARTSDPDPDTDVLRAVVDRLPEAQREVLLMRFVQDMTMAEIAAALSIPVGTAKSRLHHAIQSLRDDPRTRSLLEE